MTQVFVECVDLQAVIGTNVMTGLSAPPPLALALESPEPGALRSAVNHTQAPAPWLW